MKQSLGVLLIVSFLAGCIKSNIPPPLPAATHTGANTLGCKINGVVFVAGAGDAGRSMFGGGVDYIAPQMWEDSTFIIEGLSEDRDSKMTINARVGGPSTLITYQLNNGSSSASYGNTSLIAKVPPGCAYYATDSLNGGTVTITYYDGNILAGTFAFTAVNSCGSIQVTEGRFDISYH